MYSGRATKITCGGKKPGVKENVRNLHFVLKYLNIIFENTANKQNILKYAR